MSLSWLQFCGIVLVGTLVIGVAPFLVAVGAKRTIFSPEQRRSSCLYVSILALILLAAIINIGFKVAYPGLQSFAAAGLAKRLVLPIVLLTVLMLTFIESRRNASSLPIWWWILGATVVASSVAAAASQRQEIELVNFLQGAALFALFLMAFLVGARAPEFTAEQKIWLANAVIIGGGLSLWFRQLLQPFVALSVPAIFVAIVIAVAVPGRRVAYAAIALLLIGLQVRAILIAPGHDPFSIASAAQIGFGIAVLLLRVLPSPLRKILAVLSVAAAVAVAMNFQLISLMLGNSKFDDVTIAHRGYEAAQVIDLVRTDPLSVLVGAGPGATVNLENSPDAATLAAAGRNLAAVDDVHLLASYILLKLGLVGLCWFALLLLTIAKEVWRVAVADRLDWYNAFLVLLLVMGLASGLPAATNFLANPLPALALGMLVRSGQLRVQQETFDSKPVSGRVG